MTLHPLLTELGFNQVCDLPTPPQAEAVPGLSLITSLCDLGQVSKPFCVSISS